MSWIIPFWGEEVFKDCIKVKVREATQQVTVKILNITVGAFLRHRYKTVRARVCVCVCVPHWLSNNSH